jgi:ferritin-like metal-binding protein YciE
MAQTTSQEAIASYVTDMLALEQHIQTALEGQIADIEGDTDLVGELRRINELCSMHISALQDLADRRKVGGQGIAEAVKKAASAVLGAGAAAVDFVRTETVPKNLRDDYTALSLAVVGYIMLHTTALSLGDREVADLAHRHLERHATSVMTLHNVIPVAVVEFLQSEGLPADMDVMSQVSENIESVWMQEGVPDADEAAERVSSGSSRRQR